ncbi:MAG: peptidoglycan-binding domain-containing protein [Pseudorhodobacter sp.]|nr:peptidoglycan-binding domain-containing protein [Pseudorhodobacter sp.]
MPLTLKNTATATLVTLSLLAGSVAPAQAMGKNERNFLKGVAAAAIVGIILSSNRGAAAQAPVARHDTPRAAEPRYAEPRRVEPYNHPRHQPGREVSRYEEPRYQAPHREAPRYDAMPRQEQGRVIGSTSGQTGYGSGLSSTATAQAFNTYSYADRRMIQQQLARFGYYGGGIDGAFGPRTHQAIYEFARDGRQANVLETQAGAYAVLDALLS